MAADEDELKNAKTKRLTRLVASEIKLYHQRRLAGGHSEIDPHEQLKQDIDLGRQWLHRRLDFGSDRIDLLFRDALFEFLAVTDAGFPKGAGVTAPGASPPGTRPTVTVRIPIDKQLGKEDNETRYNLGIAYMEMGLFDEAISEFRLVANDETRRFECASLLGICSLKKGLPHLAVEWFEKGLQSPGRDACIRRLETAVRLLEPH